MQEQILLGADCLNCKQAQLICLNKYCQYNCLVCRDQNCGDCFLLHKKCRLINYENFVSKLLVKRQEMNQELKGRFQRLDKLYLDSLQQLSNQREQLIIFVQNFGLNLFQRQFIRNMIVGNKKQIKGKLISKIIWSQKSQKKTSQLITQQWITNFQEQKRLIFDQSFKRLQRLQNILNDNYTPPEIDTNILSNHNIEIFVSLFKKPIKKFNLKYRASKQSFSINKFHKKCDGLKNTVVIAQTLEGKIIGGYTPLPWGVGFGLQRDVSGQSFLFSVRLFTKFRLIADQEAIGISSKWGPIFGANDLCIGNNGNMQKSSWSEFPTSYSPGKPKCNVNDFVGGKNFKLKQWEVFEIQWKK